MIGKLTKTYAEAAAKHDRKVAEIKRKIEELNAELKLVSQGTPSWVAIVLENITREMQEEFPDRHFEILGPFGMSNEVSIHFYKNGVGEKEKFEGDNCLSITFVPRFDWKNEGLL